MGKKKVAGTQKKARSGEEMVATTYRVAQVGWYNAQPDMPMVLLKKADREAHNVGVGDVVRISRGNADAQVSRLAIVQMQLKGFVPYERVCCVSPLLAQNLSIQRGCEVQIDKEFTESQADAFKAECRQITEGRFQRMLNAAMPSDDSDDDEEQDSA
jgi:hypothetical protein